MIGREGRGDEYLVGSYTVVEQLSAVTLFGPDGFPIGTMAPSLPNMVYETDWLSMGMPRIKPGELKIVSDVPAMVVLTLFQAKDEPKTIDGVIAGMLGGCRRVLLCN